MKMDLFIGKPHKYANHGLGYALSHEMKSDFIIDKYAHLSQPILDNGADELGAGEGGMRLAYLAGRIRPSFIILPDVLHKDKETRKRGEKFFEEMKGTGYHGWFMGVIQAKTLDKGLESYKWWAKSGMVDRIGITYDTQISGKYSSEFSWGNRLSFLYEIAKSGLYEKYDLGVHMLGTLDVHELYILNHYSEFIDNGVHRMVESHDTTAPWACPTRFNSQPHKISFGRAKSWERLDFDRIFSPAQLDVAYWNTACYLSACMIPKSKWHEYIPGHLVDHYWEDLAFERYYE